MARTQTKKNALSCRVSREVFEKVKALTEGDNPPFESVSEYLYSLVTTDLGRREMNVDQATYQLLELLKKDEIKEEIKRLLK
jgi:hypothetical protein